MMNLARELSVLADLTDEDLDRTWNFMLDRLAWLQYERVRRAGDVSWSEATIQLDNPLLIPSRGGK